MFIVHIVFVTHKYSITNLFYILLNQYKHLNKGCAFLYKINCAINQSPFEDLTLFSYVGLISVLALFSEGNSIGARPASIRAYCNFLYIQFNSLRDAWTPYVLNRT